MVSRVPETSWQPVLPTLPSTELGRQNSSDMPDIAEWEWRNLRREPPCISTPERCSTVCVSYGQLPIFNGLSLSHGTMVSKVDNLLVAGLLQDKVTLSSSPQGYRPEPR